MRNWCLEMSQEKVVKRSTAFLIGTICIILVVGLAGVFEYYTMAMNDKNTAYDSYVSAYNDYVSTHSHTNFEYDLLTARPDTVGPASYIIDVVGSSYRMFNQTTGQVDYFSTSARELQCKSMVLYTRLKHSTLKTRRIRGLTKDSALSL